MLYIELQSKEAAMHFSAEEFLMKKLKQPAVMLWQTGNCAMLGRNQVAEAEVNLQFAKENNVTITRRSSGGGTIFTDAGTLLYTLIIPFPESEALYNNESNMKSAKNQISFAVVDALKNMNLDVKIEGRNDVLLNGKKISGIAQYAQNNCICTHGSLLFDADLEMLVKTLNVDKQKIISKGLDSVRSRVTNIKEHLTPEITTQEFFCNLKNHLFSILDLTEYKLSKSDLAEINKTYREKYANPEWNFSSAPKFTYHNDKRFAGGKVEVFLDVVKGEVKSCSIKGDFLATSEVAEFEKIFIGKAFNYDAFKDALRNVDLFGYLGDISEAEFLSVLF